MGASLGYCALLQQVGRDPAHFHTTCMPTHMHIYLCIHILHRVDAPLGYCALLQQVGCDPAQICTRHMPMHEDMY